LEKAKLADRATTAKMGLTYKRIQWRVIPEAWESENTKIESFEMERFDSYHHKKSCEEYKLRR